jgi:hypothetical protein
MIDHPAQFCVRQTAVDLDRIPMFLIHVITGPHLLVTVAQIERPIGIAFQIYRRRDCIERGERKHFAANFEDENVVAEGRVLNRVRFAQAIFAKVLQVQITLHFVKRRRVALEQCVEREWSGADNEQEERPEPHRKIRARLVHHAPETIARELPEREPPEAVAEKYRDLGRENRQADVDKQHNGGQPRQQSNDQQRATDCFASTHEGSRDFRSWDANLGEAAGGKFSREQEFLNAFREKDAADQKPHQNSRSRRLCGKKPPAHGFRLSA